MGMSLGRISDHISQTWPPKPKFTEKDIPVLNGKVCVVTGANSGIGKELAKILYAKHARVYVTARSREKGTQTVDDIKKEVISSNGDIIFIPLDLSDLEHTKQAARQILDKERKIHLLFNNAGVMVLSEEQRTVQGYEQQLGVNNVATHLFTKLLTPALIHTAQLEPPGTVRVIWVASSAAETPQSPKGGVPMDNLDYHEKTDGFAKYAISKAGVYFQGAEFARRHRADGVISIPLHPGILNTELFRTAPGLIQRIFKVVFTYPPIYGAYTEIFAGFSPDVTLERSGDWVVPWGRFMRIRQDLKDATKTKEEGGTGIANAFWEWNEEQVRPYI